MRLIVNNILITEPRASPLGTVRGVHHSSSGYRGMVGVPRGVYRTYTGSGIPTMGTREAYREATYLPSMVPGRHTGCICTSLPWYPGGIQGVLYLSSMVPGRHTGCTYPS